MKRAASFITLTFFLILNSGMFVCAVHCGVEKLAPKPKMRMDHACCKRSCTEKSNGDCTKKHGDLQIKENIQPGYSIRLHMPLLTYFQTPALPYRVVAIGQPFAANTPLGKAPPNKSGRFIAICYRNLLI